MEWISVNKSKPQAHEYVVLKNSDESAPPAIGWAVYWMPKREFAGFALSNPSYEDDFGDDFTHYMPLPPTPQGE